MISVLTCAGVIINADIAAVADTHKGAGCVHTHCVLPAVVFPLRTLIDICKHSRTQDTLCTMTRTQNGLQNIWEEAMPKSTIHTAAAINKQHLSRVLKDPVFCCTKNITLHTTAGNC